MTHVIFEPVDFAAPAHPCARGISASLHVIAKLAALAKAQDHRQEAARLLGWGRNTLTRKIKALHLD